MWLIRTKQQLSSPDISPTNSVNRQREGSPIFKRVRRLANCHSERWIQHLTIFYQWCLRLKFFKSGSSQQIVTTPEGHGQVAEIIMGWTRCPEDEKWTMWNCQERVGHQKNLGQPNTASNTASILQLAGRDWTRLPFKKCPVYCLFILHMSFSAPPVFNRIGVWVWLSFFENCYLLTAIF